MKLVAVLGLAIASVLSPTMPQNRAVKMPSVADSFGGQIIFAAKEVPAPSGLPSTYISKLNAMKLSSIRYGKGNKVRLHYAVFFKTPASDSRVILTFVSTIATTPRPKLTSEMLIARGATWGRSSVQVSENGLGELTYRVEARIRGQVVGTGTIAFEKAK